MPPLHLLIKPASSACNLACRYCFYHDIAEHRDCGFKGMMSTQTLEIMVKNALEYADGICGFIFQGGEPTLAGLPFYQKLIEFQTKYNVKKVRIYNSIQTNGTTLTPQWAEFLAQNSFLVGVSLDGTKNLHDSNRYDRMGKGSFERVLNGIKLLNQHHVAYNILSVITGQNAEQIEQIYAFFRRQGFSYLQFIPCLEPLDMARGSSDYALKVEDYAYFLIRIFDLWFADLKQGHYVSIRHLDNWLGILLGRAPEACNMQGRCSLQYVIEANGEVYPCDFYVLDEWLLGKLGEKSLAEIASSAKTEAFLQESYPLPEDCRHCRFVALCRNGCKRDRIGDEIPKLYYCSAIKEFFQKRGRELEEAAAILLNWNRNNKY